MFAFQWKYFNKISTIENISIVDAIVEWRQLLNSCYRVQTIRLLFHFDCKAYLESKRTLKTQSRRKCYKKIRTNMISGGGEQQIWKFFDQRMQSSFKAKDKQLFQTKVLPFWTQNCFGRRWDIWVWTAVSIPRRQKKTIYNSWLTPTLFELFVNEFICS